MSVQFHMIVRRAKGFLRGFDPRAWFWNREWTSTVNNTGAKITDGMRHLHWANPNADLSAGVQGPPPPPHSCNGSSSRRQTRVQHRTRSPARQGSLMTTTDITAVQSLILIQLSLRREFRELASGTYWDEGPDALGVGAGWR